MFPLLGGFLSSMSRYLVNCIGHIGHIAAIDPRHAYPSVLSAVDMVFSSHLQHLLGSEACESEHAYLGLDM